jgi:predicted component of type VI protein secretion system
MKKIIWSEGMLLTQQHMQTFSNQLDRRWRQSRLRLDEYAWGVSDVQWLDELNQGCLSLRSVSAVFPDGEWIDMRYEDQARPRLTIHGPGLIYLSRSKLNGVRGLSGYQEASVGRWHVSYVTQKDDWDVSRTQEIALSEPVLVLLDHPDDQYNQIPIARVVERGSQLRIDCQYVPPHLDLRPVFFKQHQVQTERILNQSLACIERYSPHYLNVLECLFDLSCLSDRDKPYALYRLMCKAVIVLRCVFRVEPAPPTCFQYGDLFGTFQALSSHLESALSAFEPDATQSLVSSVNANVFKIRLGALTPGVLAVRALKGGAEWCRSFQRNCKLAPFSKSNTVLSASAPGIPLKHKPYYAVHLKLPVAYECFSWEADHPLWKEACDECACGLFVPECVSSVEVTYIEEGA